MAQTIIATTEVTNTRSRFGLDNAVRIEAAKTQYDNPTHHDICVQLVELADKFNERNDKGHFCPNGFTHTKKGKVKPFPMSFLVYMVDKSYHRECAFNKGYTHMDTDKVATILKMLKFWGLYNNNTMLSRNDKVVHAVTKYYEKCSHKVSDFKKQVETNWKPYPKAPKTMKEITIALGLDIA